MTNEEYIDLVRVASLALMSRFDHLDPCPQCGAVDPDYRLTCLHRNDKRGYPDCGNLNSPTVEFGSLVPPGGPSIT